MHQLLDAIGTYTCICLVPVFDESNTTRLRLTTTATHATVTDRTDTTAGSPHKGLRTVHVAGTKGKGSTVAFLERILMESGYRVGAYTSPSLRSVGEMFRLGGREATEAEVDTVLAAVKAGVEAGGLRPSYFEVVTAGAFKYFREAGVDVAILEAGLGAVRDATNVLDAGALDLGVVTGVGMEHVGALGGSIEEIARAKSGVFKEGKVGVVGRQAEGVAEAVLLLEASEKRVKTYRVEAVVDFHVEEGAVVSVGEGREGNEGCQTRVQNGVTFRVPAELAGATFGDGATDENGDPEAGEPWEFDVQLSLVGKHQASNAATAIASAMALKNDSGYERISKASIVAGLERATLPGRFQVIDDVRLGGGGGEGDGEGEGDGGSGDGPGSKRVLTVVDGAHTRDSARCAAETVRQLFPDSKLAVVIAMASDKDHEGFCSEIQKARPNVVVFTETPIAGGRSRTAGPGALAGAWQVAKMKNRDIDRTWRCRELIQANVQSALAKARHELSGEAASEAAPSVILVTGSLHACEAAST